MCLFYKSIATELSSKRHVACFNDLKLLAANMWKRDKEVQVKAAFPLHSQTPKTSILITVNPLLSLQFW